MLAGAGTSLQSARTSLEGQWRGLSHRRFRIVKSKGEMASAIIAEIDRFWPSIGNDGERRDPPY